MTSSAPQRGSLRGASDASPLTARRRFPASLYRNGEEPDPRFSLANERTFLAWIRTALALVAGGVALEALSVSLRPELQFAASVLLIGTGTLIPLPAWLGWLRTERSLRHQEPLPSPTAAGPLGFAVLVISVLILLAILLA